MLTNKYLGGIPVDARAAKADSFSQDLITAENIRCVRELNRIAQRRGQTLAQMAIAWALRDSRVTSALVGARKVEQLADSLQSLENLAFSHEDLTEIDQFATEGGIDIWKESTSL